MATNNPINNTLVERTITITTGVIGNGAVENGTVQIARLAKIKRITSTELSRVRLYGDSSARTADAAREFGDHSIIGTQHRLLLDMLFTISTGLTWFLSPIAIAQNTDTPTSATIYYAIENNSGGAASITVTLKVIIEEV